MKILSVVLTLMLLIFSFEHYYAQSTAPDKIQKGKRKLVSVPVAVSDRDGRYISGLEKDDFTIFQNGIKQDIAHFATASEPLSVAIVLDTSGSTRGVLSKIKEAAEDFIDQLNNNDQCLIATFDSEVKIYNQFTSDQKTLKKSLNKIQTDDKEGSVVLRAVEQIARSSFNNIEGRKAIVLLSDGKDSGSFTTKTELLNLLEESDVSIYSIFYQTGSGFNKLAVDAKGNVAEAAPPKKEKEVKKNESPKPRKKKKGYSIVIPLPGDTHTQEEIKLSHKVTSVEAVDYLQDISDATAGRFYLSDEISLSKIFKQIAGELKQQYRLGYYSRDAGLHDISVKVKRSDAVVRAREKYRSKL